MIMRHFVLPCRCSILTVRVSESNFVIGGFFHFSDFLLNVYRTQYSNPKQIVGIFGGRIWKYLCLGSSGVSNNRKAYLCPKRICSQVRCQYPDLGRAHA